MNLNQTDLNTRLMLSQCAVGSLTVSVLKKIKIGSSDAKCKLQTLQVVQIMLSYLSKYNVLSDEVTENDNCLSEEDVQLMFDYISKKLNICFQMPGFGYVDLSQFNDSFSGSFG